MNDKLTKADIKKMEDEIEYRKVVLRKELLEQVKTARAHGDLSENFEYHAAKKEKNGNDSRIRYLERMIRTAQVLEDDSNPDEVGMNNKVTVLFEEDNSTETYKIVTTVREDSLHGLISIESPLGSALMGHKVGDRITVHASADYSYTVVIQNIDKTGGEESDKIREY